MTLAKFQKLLKKVNPRLRVRQRRYGDLGGIFVGLSGKGGYIARITKGQLQLNGYRETRVDTENKMKLKQGPIKKRGRKTLINLLRNYRWVTTMRERSMLLWGYDRNERS